MILESVNYDQNLNSQPAPAPVTSGLSLQPSNVVSNLPRMEEVINLEDEPVEGAVKNEEDVSNYTEMVRFCFSRS
jgi:hypothetical protein